MGTWLLFFLVCFAGIGFMFFCLLRRQDALLRTMQEEHAHFRVALRAMNARLDSIDEDAAKERATAARRSGPISVDEALSAYANRHPKQESSRSGTETPDLSDLEL
jgi:hypothetical protein